MIEVKKLNKTYDRRRRTANHVLKDISLTLPDRGFVCILGPSGCGKTSLLNAVGGLDAFDNGTLVMDDLSVNRYGTRAFEAERNRNFGYIFQNYYLLENHSVAYNVYLGLHSLKLTHAEKIKRVRQALQAVDMERYIRRTVGELSGGQQQRVAIARALARRPRVIFADEPTGNLDEENTRNICSLLRLASKDSLVLMVTHEENIARFFADRIITLSDGVVSDDSESWERIGLSTESDKSIYTDGLADAEMSDGAVTLRVLQEAGAEPVNLTVVALKDRIVLKLSDTRAVSLGTSEDAPRLIEGARPTYSIEEVDSGQSGAHIELFDGKEAPKTTAGRGVTASMMWGEARQLKKEKNLRRTGMRAFLILLTVLTLLTVGDFVSLSHIDPADFITTDSHLLHLTLEQGEGVSDDGLSPADRQNALLWHIYNTAPDFDYVPMISTRMSYTVSVVKQLGSQKLTFPSAFSYAPISRLDESTLIAGRMPKTSNEIVVDMLILEKLLETGDSIIKNSIRDMSFFLDATLYVDSRNFSPTIVGICDSGELTAYISTPAMLDLRNGSISLMGLSEIKEIDPENFGDVTLDPEECIVNYRAAGSIWKVRVGMNYIVGKKALAIKDAVSIDWSDAYIIVDDSLIDMFLVDGITTGDVYLYCADKDEMRSYLNELSKTWDNSIQIRVTDQYEMQYNQYAEAVHLRANARSIITATVLVVCLIMLYLLCRTQAHGRIELMAVYRLLGIPKRKVYIIFLFEGIISALTAIIPASLLTWAVVEFVKARTEISLAIILPWQVVAAVSAGILGYYLLVSVLPLIRLLKLPPAQLAAKYDM